MSLHNVNSFPEDEESCRFSPRSLEAIYSLGFSPEELLKPHVDKQVDSHTAEDRGRLRQDPRYKKLLAEPVLNVDGTEGSGAPVSSSGLLDELCGAIRQKRQAHYEAKRQKKVEQCQRRRMELIRGGDGESKTGSIDETYLTSPSTALVPTNQGGQSTAVQPYVDPRALARMTRMVQSETERVARMKKRQEASLRKLLHFELQRYQQSAALQLKDIAARQRHAAFTREKKRRAREMAEERRRVELAKQQGEVARARALAQEKAALQAKMERSNAKQREAVMRAIRHRNQVQEQRAQQAQARRERLETQRSMESQRLALKEQEILNRQEKRAQLVEERVRSRKEQAEQQRRAQQERLSQARLRQQQLQESRVSELLTREQQTEERLAQFRRQRDVQRKQREQRAKEKAETIRRVQAQGDALHEARVAAIFAREEAVERRLAQRDRALKQRRAELRSSESARNRARTAALERHRLLQEARTQELLQERALKERHSRQVRAARAKQQVIASLRDDLLEEDRREHVERLARLQERRREQLAAKIQADRLRVESMRTQQQRLFQERKRISESSTTQHRHAGECFERLRHILSRKLMPQDAGGGGGDGSGGGQVALYVPPISRGDLQQAGFPDDMIEMLLSDDSLRQQLQLSSQDWSGGAGAGAGAGGSRGGGAGALKGPARSSRPASATSRRRRPRSKKASRTTSSTRHSPLVRRTTPSGSSKPRRSGASAGSGATRRRPSRYQRPSTAGPQREAKSRQRTSSLKPRGSSRSLDGMVQETGFSPVQSGADDPQRVVEELAARQNAYLLGLLEREQQNEVARQKLWDAARPGPEQERLATIFAAERQRASVIIRDITDQHERRLAQQMQVLGLLDE